MTQQKTLNQDIIMINRRNFFTGAAAAAGGALVTRLVPTARAADASSAKVVSTGKPNHSFHQRVETAINP